MKAVITGLVTIGLGLGVGAVQAKGLPKADCENSICSELVNSSLPKFDISTLRDHYYRHRFHGRSNGSSNRRSHHRGSRSGMGSLPRHIPPPGERVFMFSPRLKAWAAYGANGHRVAHGPANGGAHYCADTGRACRTPVGSFRIKSKGHPGCVSSRYPRPRGGAPMPYCMFFKGNYAIHGSPHISNRNGSHGCIRVKTSAAAWLSHNFIRHGTKVIVRPY